MPDSVGARGFPRNINVGHEHLDIVSGFTYQYQGGVSSNVLNWKIIDGVTPVDPSTASWGIKQLGAMWFNKTEKAYKYWDGNNIVAFSASSIGLIATRCLAPVSRNITFRQLMSRSPHYARTAITSLQIIIPNWFVDPTGAHAEIGTGSSATVTASIEYPTNTFTQILFGGSVSGTVPDVSQLLSDAVSVSIPNGALFWVRIYWVSPTGTLSIAHNLSGTGLPGAGLEVGVSGITDKTMSGTVTAADNEFSPVAIVGTTSQPSVVIVGDSIGLGDTSKETIGDASGDFGVVARSIGPYYAYASFCQNGDQGEDFVASHANRVALFQYASHLICEYGSNDLYTVGADVATVLATLQTIGGYMIALGAGKRAYQVTITPRTTSTDSWATTVNQTVLSSAIEARRISVNDSIRGILPGLTGYYDVADAIETSRNSGIWRVTGLANGYTPDGTHPNTPGSLLVPASGVIPPSL